MISKTIFATLLVAAVNAANEPNPPHWDTSRVLIFENGDPNCQERVDAVWREMGGPNRNGHFSNNRYALMFKPGSHCNVNVGYYTQVVGLGLYPSDTVIPNLYSPDSGGDALDNFWRGVENVEIHDDNRNVMWHVS